LKPNLQETSKEGCGQKGGFLSKMMMIVVVVVVVVTVKMM
jgi:hypothetical protein